MPDRSQRWLIPGAPPKGDPPASARGSREPDTAETVRMDERELPSLLSEGDRPVPVHSVRVAVVSESMRPIAPPDDFDLELIEAPPRRPAPSWWLPILSAFAGMTVGTVALLIVIAALVLRTG